MVWRREDWEEYFAHQALRELTDMDYNKNKKKPTRELMGKKAKKELDNVNKPQHYAMEGLGNYEAKDVIVSVLGLEGAFQFYMGNVIKYVLRYKKKNGVEDLKKARVYLNWAIDIQEKLYNGEDWA